MTSVHCTSCLLEKKETPGPMKVIISKLNEKTDKIRWRTSDIYMSKCASTCSKCTHSHPYIHIPHICTHAATFSHV